MAGRAGRNPGPGDERRAAGAGARRRASILSEVLRRRPPLDAATMLARAILPSRDAGFARAIASETLRRFGQLDALIRTFVPSLRRASGWTPPGILLAGACELLFLDVAAHAAVDAANRLAAADDKAVHFKPLINACSGAWRAKAKRRSRRRMPLA